ncbi:MFS transporter [Micromonospora sp. M12]
MACVLPVFLLGGLAVQMGQDLSFSPAGLGVAVAVYFGVSALASVPSGRLVERFGPALVARCGILLAAGSMLAVAALARSYPVLVGLLALSAAAERARTVGQQHRAGPARAGETAGLSFGVKQAAIPVSTLLAGAAVPTIALTVGWRWAFVAAAVAALTTLPAVPGSCPV